MARQPDKPVLSVWRTEEKYLLDYAHALRLREKLACLMDADAFGPEGYRVRSLYFDSFHNIDYAEKDAGVRRRKKIRLRIYDEDQPDAKLELKEKNGDLQHKSSLLLSREQALALCDGERSFLLDIGSETALRLYSLMTLGFYQPAALIEYDRRAYTWDAFSTRLTFDSRVRGSELDLRLYEKDLPWFTVLDDQVLLEVKYNQVLPRVLSQVLDHENLHRVSVSKYASGRLGLAAWLY